MKSLHYLFIIFLQISISSYSQKKSISPVCVELLPITAITTSITAPKTIKSGTPSPLFPVSVWAKKNTVGFDLNEIAFLNWSAGGVSSISGLFKANFTRIHMSKRCKWANELIVRYGINKQEGFEIIKSDDEFRFNSTLSHRQEKATNWFHSAKFSFNTQFTNGYVYPDTATPVSRILAPAYTFLGAGANYFDKKEEKKFDIYISPITIKSTLVLDQTLANMGAFGVQMATYDSKGTMVSKGKNSKTEFGFLITNYYKKEIWKNITIENRLSLYSDYLNNFGNIDVEWKLQFDLVVNQYVSANIGAHAIYDDDIKTIDVVDGENVSRGPTLQLKQTLGIGMTYVF